MKEELKDRITRVAEELEFSTYISKRYDEPGNYDVEFSGFTNLGQNIVFSAIMENDDPHTLVEDLHNGYEAYDPDYEASLWIGDDGHGKNGAPYHIADIVSDMRDAERQYEELYEAMRKEFADYPEDCFDEDEE